MKYLSYFTTSMVLMVSCLDKGVRKRKINTRKSCFYVVYTVTKQGK